VATDRGVSNDQYDTEIRVYGTESDINILVNFIETNRTTGGVDQNILTLSRFNSQEHIFGADLDYTGSLTATVNMNRLTQHTWKGFEVTLKLTCLSPSFLSTLGSLPTLRFLDVGYDADSNYTIVKYDSYNRIFTYQDPVSDVGTFTGNFTFDDAEMARFRRFLAMQRGATIFVTGISGVDYPFGRRSVAYPINVKIIKFEDGGMLTNINMGSPRWTAKITMAEYIYVLD
jgi:hypothetical protein